MQKRSILIALLTFLFLSMNKTAVSQTVLNDGGVRLRVWLHKVWTNANCDDLGDQEYVFKDIRVKPNGDLTSLGWSPNGLAVRTEGDENRWWGVSEWVGILRPSASPGYPMTQDAIGILMMDVTYNTSQVPKFFDWSIREMWEDDHTECPFPCSGGTNIWVYNPSFCCGALNDDNFVGYRQEIEAASFRGGPPGEIMYMQSATYGGGEQESYSLLFAYQWEYVDPLPPLPDASTNETSGGIKYQDGPVTLQVDLMGLFSDSDYDYAPFNCTFGFADNEDLRLKWRATDNLAPFSGGTVCINTLSQSAPRWNLGNPISTLFNKTYTTTDLNFESFNLEFEYWEEDGCGSDCNYDVGCTLGITNDDANSFGTSGLINWRNSIPTYSGQPDQWNYLDFPFRTSSRSYTNWSIRVRYKWVQEAPTVTANGTFERTLCLGTSTQLNVSARASTFYQWQVAEPPAVTGPSGPACPPSGTIWTNISGANWKDFTPPQTPGTRIYRCVVSNRTGEGSYTSSGPRLREAYSDCYRITYFPYAPPIVSNACGSSIVGGIAYPFSVPVDPQPNAVANALSYTWSVSPNVGVVISNPNSPATTISFPPSDNSTSYTISMTVSDACGVADAVSTCTSTITSDYCGIIYVAPPASGGDNTNIGSPIAPVATFAQAISISANSGGARSHIKILEGNYIENTVLQLNNNLTVEGGYRLAAGEWIKNSAAITSITLNGFENGSTTGNNNIEHRMGFKANGVNGWTLQDLNITTSDVTGQTPTGRGRSNYAIWINNSSDYSIVRCRIRTGTASNGADGVTPGGLGSAGGGGSGGNGATGSDNRCNCNGQSTAEVGNAGNGGAGGGNRGNNCCGGGCNWVGCDAGGCIASGGNNGQRGGDGGGYNFGDRAATPTITGAYFIPADAAESGNNATGGGGGGGGGGGDIGSCCTCSCGSGRPNGGRGGNGGGGGAGGSGGRGGGSSFAIFRNNSNTGASILNNNYTIGAAGAGGLGADGQTGAPGEAGTPGINHGGCDGGRGGNGGNGGEGGIGGRGRDGANGISAGICTVDGGNASFSTPSTAVPNSEITAKYQQGCSFSEITLTSPFSGIAFSSLDTGGDIIQNITSSSSTYADTDDPLIVYYTSSGRKDLSIAGNTFVDFLHINTNRIPPSIDGLPSGLCFNNTTINLASTANSPTVPTEFEWSIQRMPVTGINAPVPLFNFNVEDPGEITLPTNLGCPNIFQIRLRVKDECCGWSSPVYHYISVENPTNNNTIAPPVVRSFCTSGDPAIINGSLPGGGTCDYKYQWQMSTNGGPFTNLTGGNAQNYDPPVLNVTGSYQYIRIENSGACGIDTSNIVTLEVLDAPSNEILPDPGVLCAGDSLQIFGNAVQGTGTINSNLWTGTGATYLNNSAIANPIFDASALSGGSYTLIYTVRDNLNCSAATNTTVTVSVKPNITNPPANSEICSGQTFNYSPTSNIAANLIYESIASANISGNSGAVNPGIGNISDVLVNTGTNAGTVIYNMYPATTAGCSGTPITWTVTVNPPSSNLVAQIDRNNLCSDDAGNITLSIDSATGEPIQWFSGSCGGTLVGIGSPLVLPSPSVNTTYFARFNNCASCTSVNLIVDEVPTTAILDITQSSCAVNTGSVVVSAPIGAQWEYNLDGSTYQSTPNFSGITPGNHAISVRNIANSACSTLPSNFTINPISATPADAVLDTIQPSCTNATGSISVISPLGGNFAYSMDAGAFQIAPSFLNVGPGNHSILVRNTTDTTCLSNPTIVNIQAAPGTPLPIVIDTSICIGSNYILPDGTIVTSSGNFQTILPSASGCDSLTTTNLLVLPEAIVDAGEDISLCASNPPIAITWNDITIGGSATQAVWSISSGNGTLSNTIFQDQAGLNATSFTPSIGFNGTVVLTLTSNEPLGPCNAVIDTKTIVISPLVSTSVITHD